MSQVLEAMEKLGPYLPELAGGAVVTGALEKLGADLFDAGKRLVRRVLRRGAVNVPAEQLTVEVFLPALERLLPIDPELQTLVDLVAPRSSATVTVNNQGSGPVTTTNQSGSGSMTVVNAGDIHITGSFIDNRTQPR